MNEGEEFIFAVANSKGCFVDFFSTRTGKHLGRIDELVRTPHEMTVDAEQRLMYMAHTYRTGVYGGDDRSHEISVIDPDKIRVTNVIDIAPYVAPHDVEFDPESGLLYASVEPNPAGERGIVVIDPQRSAVVGIIPTAGINSHWLAISPNGRRGFVAHKDEAILSVLDLESRTLIDTVPAPGGSEELDISPDGRWVYVATPALGMRAAATNPPRDAVDRPVLMDPPARVLKIDAENGQVVGFADLEPHLGALRVLPDGDLLVTQILHPNEDRSQRDKLKPGRVWLIDSTSMKVRHSTITDRMPFTARAQPDGSVAYVANNGAGTVSVLDLPSLTVIDTWSTTPTPEHQIVPGTHGMALLRS